MTISKKISDQIDDLVDELNDSNKTAILNRIRKIVRNDNPKPRTQTIRYSLIKRRFKSKTDDNEFLKEIRPPSELTDGVVESNAKIRDNQKMITMERSDIDKIIGLSDSNNIFDLAIYLLFVTGRRTSELMNARFYNKKHSNLVQISGVLKRTDHIDCEFPILIGKTKFFKIYNRFKNLQKHTNEESFHRTLNRKFKRMFPGKQFKPHTMRGFYVTYLFKFRNKTDTKINTFIRDNLCHQSINASLNYTQYKLDDSITKDFVR